MKKNAFFPSCNSFVKGAGLSVFFAALLFFSNGAYAGKKTTLTAKAGKSNTVSTKGNTAGGSDISCHPAASDNPYLSNLTISAGVFQPPFDPNPLDDTTNVYLMVSVGSTVAAVTLTPTAYSGTAAITVNGTPVASGTASSPVSLNTGENDIYVDLTDGSSSFEYIILVTKYPPVTVSYSSPQTLYQGVGASVTPATSNVGTFGLAASATAVTPSNFTAGAVCLDAAGNVYFLNGNSAFKIPAAGGPAINLASGFNNPSGIAVDASGVVYVADSFNNAVKKIPAGGGAPITIGTGFSRPNDVAVDAAGNVYVADFGNNALKEILARNGQTVTVVSFPSPGNDFGLAMDKAGNLYIAGGALMEIPAGDTTLKVLTRSLDFNHVAIDKYGDFFATTSDSYICLLPATSINLLASANDVPLLSAYLPASPSGIAVDASLNIYISSIYSRLTSYKQSGGYLLTTALPSGLTFNNGTGVISGVATATSPATNYTVIAYGAAASASATVNLNVATPPAPTLSYSSPQTLYIGEQVTGFNPVSSYVAAPVYNNASTVFASGLTAYAIYLAQDGQGNFYVSNNANGIIQEVPAAGGPPVNVFTAASKQPVLAADAAGDIFESDGKNVYKILKGSNTATLVASGFKSITGMVIDPSGDIIVADVGAAKKILASDGSISTIPGISAMDVALDGAGNIYGSDPNDAIWKFSTDDGSSKIVAELSFQPWLFSVDAAGDIFIGSGNSVYEIPAGGGDAIVLGSGFTVPRGVVVARSGNVYIADARTIKEFQPTGGYTITPALPAGLNLNNATGAIIGNPVTPSPATTYMVSATNLTATTTATLNITVTPPPLPTISYASPQTYLNGVPITPLTPATTNVFPFHYSHTSSTLGSGFSLPTGVARDAAGNVYVADNGNNAVKKIPAGGGTPVVIGSGFSHPVAVALDAAGNVYVADYGNNAVKKIPAGGGAPVTLGAGFLHPSGVAVDAAGNVYVSDYGNNAVKKIPVAGGDPISLASGFSHPEGLAISNGNLYIADAGNNAVKKLPAGWTTAYSIFTGSGPHGVAISGAGNIYVANTGANSIVMIPAGVDTVITLGSGFKSPAGIVLDGAGDVYIADQGNNAIKELQPEGGFFIVPYLSSGLVFNSNTGVIIGEPTGLSPAHTYTVTGYNPSGSVAATVNLRVISPPFLTNLTVNVGTLSPAFYSYPISTSYSDAAGSAATIKVTPTTNEPDFTITVNGAAVASGTASAPITLSPGANTILVVVTASDGVTKKTYTITVGQGSNDAYLSNLSLNGGSAALTPSFAFKTFNYTAAVSNSTASITVKPSLLEATASVTVNGSPVANKTASGPIPLAVGANYISIVVTAPDGVTTKTYNLTVNRGFSTDAYLSNLKVNTAALSPAFAFKTFSYTSGVPNSIASVTVTPTLLDTTATVTVNGVAVASKTASWPIALTVGPNTVNIAVTAQDAATTQTYILTITRAPSTDAYLSNLKVTTATLSPAFAFKTFNYTSNVPNSTDSVTVTPTLIDATASSLTVNGIAVANKATSAPIALAVGANTINIGVIAQDGATTQTYTVTITRASGGADEYDPISVTKPTETPVLAEDGIKVHNGVSPNGDGIDDFLQIEGIANYPDNKLMIMNRNGQLVFEAKGYDNGSKVFDGHSNKNGQMQLPGTYFYQLDYTVNGITKHKTGFLVLKY